MTKFLKTIKTSANELKSTSALTVSAMLTSLNVVLHFFTVVVSDFLQISFSFLPLALTGFLYGPVVGGIAGALGDILKYIMRPTGAFFPGFTFNAFLTGFLFGLILYKKPVTLSRVFIANLCVTVIVHLFFTPLWLSMMYGKGFIALFSVRIVKNIVMLPIETAMLYSLAKVVSKVKLPKHSY